MMGEQRSVLVFACLIGFCCQPTMAQNASVEEMKQLRLHIRIDFGVDLPPLPVPLNNPQTAERVALGEALFFDPNLSSCGTIACASCHSPEMGFSDGERVSDGCGGRTGRRNSNTIYNTAYMSHLFWDGRVQTLEEQALGPVVDPAEMANTWEAVLRYLDTGVQATGKSFPGARLFYQNRFQKAFGGRIDSTTVSKALAAYERSVVSQRSPYDRWVAGDDDALSPQQQRGMLVFFGRGECVECHAPPNFSDSDFHNIGVPNAGFEKASQFPHNARICGGITTTVDPGRAEVLFLHSSCRDVGRFRTPTLRNVELTGPYMHNGVFNNLEAVVRHYETLAKGFAAAVVGELDGELEGARIGDSGGEPTDVADLVAFLRALTGTQVKSPPRGTAPPSLPY